jgi:predicted ATPase
MFHLKSISLKLPASTPTVFPFTVPLLKTLPELHFTTPVTFFVGENGSGKSTLLEAIACAAGSITVGSEGVETDKTLAEMRKLARHFKLVWHKKTRRGFFLRAEDFFGYAKRLNQMRAELQEDLAAVDEAYQGRSKQAIGLAKMPYARELHELERRYGEGLDARSHGESFLTLFQTRFVPGGLYLLDEPEAPLSPLRQLTFLALLKQMVAQEAQFIIATHSPLILAFPGATILSFDATPLRQMEYEALEHVTLTREFLNNPALYLKHL